MRPIQIVLASCLLFMPAAASAQPGSPVPPLPRDDHAPRAWFSRYQESRSGPEQSDEWSRTFKVGPNGSLDLSNIAGDVTISGAPGDEIRIDAVKRVRARDGERAKQLLSSLSIEATESGGRVEVTTMFPRTKDVNAEVDYTVRVPFTVTVSARTVAGDLDASKIKGEVRLESVSGSITTSGVTQLTRAKTVSGDVEISEATAGDVLSVGTVSGTLTARRLKAKSVEVQTVSGDLNLGDTICERAQVRSVSGNIEYAGPLVKNGRYEFGSHSGDIRIMVTGGTGFELSAGTFSGDLRSELKLAGTPAAEEPIADRHGPGKRELRGTYGDGSALLLVKTFSGSVTVAKGAEGKKPKDK
jgi:DUF4097 and DUF4098 domain-containing protein YvlB